MKTEKARQLAGLLFPFAPWYSERGDGAANPRKGGSHELVRKAVTFDSTRNAYRNTLEVRR